MDYALPETCEVAFKEWAGICAAIREGTQTIILRKGGVAEGPMGFVPEHHTFWLYPTFVHEAEQGLKYPIERKNDAEPGYLPIDTLVHIESVTMVDEWPMLEALDGLHAWTPETVQKRFVYRRLGLWVMAVRAFVIDPPHNIVITPGQLGCKTWVPLESHLSTEGARPVRSDEEAAADQSRLADILKNARLNS